MKLRAIHPIKNGLKWVEPGKGFDCNKEDAEGLILAGYAEAFSPLVGNGSGVVKNAPDPAGGGVDTSPAQISPEGEKAV